MRSRFKAAIGQIALVGGIAGAAIMPSMASAQAAPGGAAGTTSTASAESENSLTEIVVTGTSLRGVAPAGAETFAIDSAQIQATSVLSTDQLLANIPQLSSFGTLPTGNAGGTQLTVNRTNLRNLPQGVGGASPTLVLMDGHRLVGEGVSQSFPDPDVIPPALIERVDVLTDGGSAIYGADAVGGVINFITKKNFDGLDVGVREGLGPDSYRSTDANVTAGKGWDSGGLYVGYSYSKHDPIYGFQRGYVHSLNYTTGLPTGVACNPANALIGTTTYAVIGGKSLALSNANLCDTAREGAIYPEELHNSVLAGFRQQITDNLEFEVKGYYSERDDTSNGGPQGGVATVTSSNPNYISTGGGSTASQQVNFNFAPVGGYGIVTNTLQSAGVTPTLTWKMPWDWQLRAFYNYGESRVVANNPIVNTTALAADVTAGTINPYNIATSNANAIGQVLNYVDFGIGKDKLSNAKATFDGPVPVIKLPGGDIRLAVGAEYAHEQYEGVVDATDTNQGAAIDPLQRGSRHVYSEFAELSLPLIGPANDIPFLYSVSLSAAERHDNYSDFGNNWAPNFGATIKPISWIGVRARFNRSFQAPSIVQIAQSGAPSATAYPAAIVAAIKALQNPAVPYPGGQPIVAIQGTLSPLQPERSRDYNFGFDISPPWVPGLDIHATYWNIQYIGQISAPALGSGVFWGVPTFEALVLSEPSAAQLQSFMAAAGVTPANIATVLASVAAQGGQAYYAADIRARNLGLSYVNGADIAFNYGHPVPFGTVYANFNSSYTNLAINAADGVDYLPILPGVGANQAGINVPRFTFATVLGATVGPNYRAQLTWNHLNGFSLSTPVARGQTGVAAFNTVDLYTQYDLKQLPKGLPPVTLSLGITNLFGVNPPVYYGTSTGFGAGYANGNTVGRVFQLGAEVKL